MTWYEKLAGYFKYFCWCCVPPNLREKPPTAKQETRVVAEEGQGKDGDGVSSAIFNLFLFNFILTAAAGCQ